MITHKIDHNWTLCELKSPVLFPIPSFRGIFIVMGIKRFNDNLRIVGNSLKPVPLVQAFHTSSTLIGKSWKITNAGPVTERVFHRKVAVSDGKNKFRKFKPKPIISSNLDSPISDGLYHIAYMKFKLFILSIPWLYAKYRATFQYFFHSFYWRSFSGLGIEQWGITVINPFFYLMEWIYRV